MLPLYTITKQLQKLLCLLPAIVLFNAILTFKENIPIMDDYDSILGFMHDFRIASIGHKLQLLIAQSNEHRLLFSRLIYGSMEILGVPANFRSLSIFSFILLLLAGWALISLVEAYAGRCWFIIAFTMSTCLFSLVSYENAFISCYGIQNYGLLTLFLWSLLSYTRHWVIPGAVLQGLMIFSSGNGMIGSIVLIPITRHWKVTSCISLLIPLYFIGYHSTHSMDLSSAPLYFTRMVGTPFSLQYSELYGIIILFILLVTLPYRSWKLQLPFFGILAFVLGSMILVAIFRSGEPNSFQGSRYQFYSQLLLAIVTYFCWIRLKTSANIRNVALGICIVISYTTGWKYGMSGFTRMQERVDVEIYYPDSTRARVILKQAIDEDLYDGPE